MATRSRMYLALSVVLILVLSACNLSGSPSEEDIAQTATAALTQPPSRTPLTTSGVPTTIPLTQQATAQRTNPPTFVFPTAIVVVPTRVVFPTSAPPATAITAPVSIVMLSPVPGNVVAGNVQILGSATHPQFLQYQVEFGPDPNGANLWYTATPAITTPVNNGLLGIWNTTSIPDGRYQLRLRVYLRDGTLLTTVVNNITVQNRINTPVPSPTQDIPRPIAAFTQDKASGDVPLTVRFTNQSSGTINVVQWNFGDGNTSSEVNPLHTFGVPGLYNVTLQVTGPGGSSNVARQINVTSPTAPVAGFTQDRVSGLAPLTVQFTDQSTGNIIAWNWNFSDGSSSSQRNPQHTFNVPGTYNVFLTVSGPGGSSSVTRQITVTSATPPTNTPSLTPSNTPTPTFTPSATSTGLPAAPQASFTQNAIPGDPLTIKFTNQSTGTNITSVWDFGDGSEVTSEPSPQHTYAAGGTYTVRLIVTDDVGRTSQSAATLTLNQPGNPDFTYTVNNLTVNFTSTSTGSIVSGAWDFGDGTPTSGAQNPTHTYAAGGTYTVTLTVTDANGITTIASQQVTVTALPTATFTATTTTVPPTATFTPSATFTATATTVPPTATFTPSATSTDLPAAPQANFTSTAAPGSPLTIQFTNQSTGTNITSVWDFGDGSEVTSEPSPQHTYAAGGTYTVRLIVTDDVGRTSQSAATLTLNQPGNPDFTYTVNNLTVNFTSTSTGSIVSGAWDFGDGSPTSGDQNPTHTYTNPGTYTVTLTVTDANGATDSASQQVTVSAPLAAGFTASASDLTVTFDSSTSTGPVAGYIWDFGDGQPGSNDANPSHTYATTGTYTVSLSVIDNQGNQSAPFQQQVTVNAPLAASFSAAPTDLTVAFDSSTSTGPIAGYIWDFGDGSGANDANPSHTYAAAGTYTVTLVVTDNQGGQSQPFQQQVNVSAPLTAGFTASVANLTVTFDSSTSTGAVAGYIWDFGDGQPGSNDANPQHTYAAAGTYTVSLSVIDNQGNQSQPFQQQVVVSAPLSAAFTASVADLTATFDSSTSTGPIAGYIWDFGDGSGANDANPQHAYAAPGTYNVTLVVTDNQGNQSQPFQQPVTVSAPLSANFTFAAQPDGLTVQFTDASTGPVAGYAWDFGDGQPGSNDANPQHAYAAAGMYTVTLVVTDNQGNPSQPSTQQVNVSAPLAASFTATPADLTVTFDSSSSTGAVAGYIWDFGDGQPGSNDANPSHTFPADGTYNVTLVVIDNQGNQSQPFQQPVTVAAAIQTLPQQPTLVDTTPVLPDINALSNVLRGIYTNGVNSFGTQSTIFGQAGDSVFTQPGILDPFAPGGLYDLSGNNDLQPIIDFFNQGDLSGATSFSRTSLAVNPGYTAQDLLDPNRADPSCNGATPLVCELQFIRPVLMFVSVGSSDALNGTDPAQFQQTLSQIVSTISSTGTIPVLMTVPDDGSNPNTAAINDAIITVAQQNNVPLLNVARALNELQSENLATSPSGAGSLSSSDVTTYGVNAVNSLLLQVLRDARNIVFPDA